MGLKKLNSIATSEDGVSNKKVDDSTTLERFSNTLTDELVFAICSPIGSKKEKFIDKLKEKLERDYNYRVNILKLSDFIIKENYKGVEKFDFNGEGSRVFKQYYSKIQLGNLLRKERGYAFLAEKAIQKIHLERVDEVKNKQKGLEENSELDGEELIYNEPKAEDYESRRVCYIIDSFKNLDELRLFQNIYSENFYLISVFSSLEDRKSNLKEKDFSDTEIIKIIELDDKQKEKFGQNVRDVFVEGDLFIRASTETIPKIELKVSRFLHLIFETGIITPTIEETAMYNAKAAAGNSSCLSRQVGACIIDEKNNILSVGWNDVPKYGGNLYFSNDDNDNRCFVNGKCSNDTQKNKVVKNIVDTLLKDSIIKNALGDIDGIEKLLIDNIRQNSKVKDLIEFSRSVHAEMHAIIQGALTTGDKILSSRLFCTTYPCHNCARHIVAAGIKEVYYIEPYVKSLCLTLHDDSMTEREDNCNKVKILIFDGVSPNRYLSFFTNFAERKQNGELIVRDLKTAKPKMRKSLQALSTLEQQAVITLNNKQ
ncbi:anti-phage dCTP deaminase [Myroides odoratimimus]|uniref:anti-phage dCTP deaminase n=1 Tax=Myroides odoratimimus TaxID=76832 RepID=UPI002DC036A8|nr:anti-phage dCTP deaminase [Myroides odoratimimus]MEC4041897.1 anti-phage dCTP deaminase [Myroides odoratimimus]MEC4149871.1 anti-phage dCTP deaminase [Myroides odoratimimus]